MANKKLNQLVTKPSIGTGDLFPLADATTGQLYKTTISDLGTAIGSGVSSVNTLVGAVVLDTDDIQELASPVNKWYTDLRARAAISAGTGISYNSGTGVITNTITQYTDALARAAVSLTTTGSNGSATYNSTTGVLNVPSYTLSGLGGQPLAGNLTALAGLSYSSIGFIKMTGVGTLALDTNTYLTTSDAASTYALDSAVVKLTGNQTIAGQKTFSSTLFGTSGLFSGTVSANYVSISADAGGNGIYLTHNSSFNSIVVTQSGAGSAIYATGKLTVIGTAYISGQLQLGSATFLTNLSQTITLPTSSGTLALTSQLSSYLPLVGGTLTGALSGTSATFSANASATYFTATAGQGYNGNLNFNYNNANTSSFGYWGGGTNTVFLVTSTGAATFSSSVTANSFIQTSGSGTYLRAYNYTWVGGSGGDYGSVGYNIGYTTTTNTYNYSATDFSSMIRFHQGGFQFKTAPSGTAGNAISYTDAVTITNSGNVGIGTTSPDTLLHVYGAAGWIKAETSSTGSARFQAKNATQTTDYGTDSSGGFIQTNGAYPLIIYTNQTERMRITSGGKLLVNTTTILDDFTINGGIRSFGSNAGFFFNTRGNSDNNVFFGWYSNTSSLTYFYSNGNGNVASINNTTGVYMPLSDKNKKKDFEESSIGLNEILQLKPTLYRMKSDNTQGQKELGFIAQEVKGIIPSAYQESKDFIGLNFNPIVAALTKAVQELKAELDTLKNK
jgi:hypothetical protein